MNLYHALYDKREPDSPALCVPGLTAYATSDLIRHVGCYASALHELGVRQGDRVSFKLEKSPEVIFLAHACLQLGAILHPLNISYTDPEIAYLLADAEPALFVCEPEEEHRFHALAERAASRLETLAGGGRGTLGSLAAKLRQRTEIARVDDDATAAILYTSGTTGKPKGAQITHGNLAQSAQALGKVWKLGASDTLLHALPVYHAHGLLTAINTMLTAGGAILFLSRFDPKEVVETLPSATLMMGVPTHYARLVREPGFPQALTPAFRLAISGSAPLPRELADQYLKQTGRRIIERYGSTEAAIVTAVPADAPDRSGWVGWPLPGVELRVADANGARVPRGATGVLETRGHNVFSGYWKMPTASEEAFTADGWFITGDVAEVDDTGCVRLLDRAKDMVITGGLNVYPREVEAVLDSFAGIAQSAVFGLPHPDFGEAVAAVVELEPGAALDETALIGEAKRVLAAYKVPKRILALAAIPRNHMGKVLKAELRTHYQTLFTP